MRELRVPKLNSNDAEYILTEWIAEDDKPVKAGQPVVVVETSKAAEELASEEAGLLWQLKAVGEPCLPGDVIAHVVPIGTQREQVRATYGNERTLRGEPTISVPARALMAEHNIGIDEVKALQVAIVKSSDIHRIIDSKQPAEWPQRLRELSAHQRAVAKTVTLSHQVIPCAFAVVRVDVGAAMTAARAESTRLRLLVGLPELVVAAVARLHEDFPLAYAAPVEQDEPLRSVSLAERAHVGVTFDIGKGLAVPVIRDADKMTFANLARILGAFRATALKGKFREEDLRDGVITVTLHTDADVLFAVPVIFPGQTCSIALAGSRTEIAHTSGNSMAPRMVTDLGLAYDHRVMNGRDAVLYLQAVKRLLESPDELIGAAS